VWHTQRTKAGYNYIYISFSIQGLVEFRYHIIVPKYCRGWPGAARYLLYVVWVQWCGRLTLVYPVLGGRCLGIDDFYWIISRAGNTDQSI
jgi:hypothetical protein